MAVVVVLGGVVVVGGVVVELDVARVVVGNDVFELVAALRLILTGLVWKLRTDARPTTVPTATMGERFMSGGFLGMS